MIMTANAVPRNEVFEKKLSYALSADSSAKKLHYKAD